MTKVLESNLLSGGNQGRAGKPLLISPTHTGALMIPRGQWSLPEQAHQVQAQAFPTPAVCALQQVLLLIEAVFLSVKQG